jgi:HEAT repeat protein
VMRRRSAIALFSLLAGAALLAMAATRLREPRYEGKRLSAWLAELDFNGPADRAAHERAAQAVHAMGTNALPRLTAMLRAQDSALRRNLARLLAKQTVIRVQVTSSRRIQAIGVQGYQALGEAAKVNLPLLIRLMGEEGSPPEVRASVAVVLGNLGREAAPAIAVLSKATQNTNEEVRLNAILALANIQRNTDEPRF